MMLWLAGFQIQFDSYRTAWRNCPKPLTDLVRLLHLSTQGTDQNTLLLIKKNLNAEKQKPKDLYINTSGGRNPYHFEILIFINNFQNQYQEITTGNVQCCTFQPHLINKYICKQKTVFENFLINIFNSNLNKYKLHDVEPVSCSCPAYYGPTVNSEDDTLGTFLLNDQHFRRDRQCSINLGPWPKVLDL